ncbi:MAG: PKD domain-containing protein [Bacteroidetes bacterium]|nr:PKD domain-containing protein [Bacteroidota bacterium]
MTVKKALLTEDLKPSIANYSYFNIKFTTLKHLILFLTLIIAFLQSGAQNNRNIEFIENKGQWDSRVQYMGEVSNGAVFIRSGGITMLQYDPVAYANTGKKLHDDPGSATDKNGMPQQIPCHAWDIDFEGASLQAKLIPDKPLNTYNNYYIGNDPSRWAGNCRLFQGITMENVYPNIDARYYTDNGMLKYDLIVKPGGDVSRIVLRYKGVDDLQVKNKELTISTSVGEMKEGAPYTYQFGPAGKTKINCRYSVKNNEVRFDVKNYDPTSTLIIDPSIVFCTFAGSTVDNWGFTATYGPDGSLFGGGIVFGPGFPATVGPGFQSGTFDMGIIKISADGASRVYATYIGGSGLDQPHSLICDNQGQLIMAGRSNSTNYPLVNNGALAGGQYDIVVTKFNANGNVLIGSRKIGGSNDDGVNISVTRALSSLQRNYGDDGRSEVNIDGAGNVYVASATSSTNFPVTAGAAQSTNRGLQDGVLLKFNPTLSTLNFASYFGGNGNDAAYVLSVNTNGNIYVAGGTESNNLLGNTAGTIGTSNRGGVDGFVTIFNNTGTALLATTYIGTSGADQIFGIQFDQKGFPYIMGQTTGNWVPINATYSNAGGKQFIGKMQPDLSAYVYTTMFGTGSAIPNISPVAFLVDRCENVYISGWGGPGFGNGFTSAGTSGLPVTPDAFKSTTDGKDFYFFVLKRDAVSQLFGSFFGENNNINGGNDHVDGGTSRFDRNGVIYQAVCANCKINGPHPNFPTTLGSWSPNNPAANTNSGSECNLGMIKIAMNLAGVAAGVQSSINGAPRDTAGCAPLTVDFIDTVANGVSYEWYFNYVPGNPPDLVTTSPSSSHIYNAVGVYQVMLVAVDPTTCNIRDSSFMHIKVGDVQANLAAQATKVGACNSFTYRFDNLSTTLPLFPFKNTSFIWDFGDGSPRVTAGLASVNHTFPGPGNYTIWLILNDTVYCNNPDSVKIDLGVAENVDARFDTPLFGCVPYRVQLDNISIAGQTWLWNFGDGPPATTSTQFEPTFTYTATGTYTITLIAYNPNTCNQTDTARITIRVLDKPVALFDFTPVTPVPNTPVTFNNFSSPDAVRFRWRFGDGDSLLTTSRAPVLHQYNATGTFTACLTAYNAANCDSTVCLPVRAVIIPLVDVPNAFTPLSNDVNSVVFVRGFGIAKMQFTIWNRWGQKVFETNNKLQGWDGKVKGVVQPMDVYAYTLSVEFSDGQKTTKKGDITLIR